MDCCWNELPNFRFGIPCFLGHMLERDISYFKEVGLQGSLNGTHFGETKQAANEHAEFEGFLRK